MKKIFLVITIALSLNASGIPVVDAAANTSLTMQVVKQAEEMVNTAKRWTETAMHYKQQIDHYTKDFIAKTGIKDVVQVIRNAKGIYDDVAGYVTTAQGTIDYIKGKPNGLRDQAIGLMTQFLPDDFCGNVAAVGYEVCKNQTLASFEDLIFFTNTGDRIVDEVKNINELTEKLRNSQDIKSSADIQGAIGARVANLETTKIQLDLYMAQMKLRREMFGFQKQNEAKKSWTTPSSLKF